MPAAPNEVADLRRAVGLLAGGVVVVTATDTGEVPRGMTTTAVSAISFEPLRVVVSMAAASRTRTAVQASRAFALNLLDAGQEEAARHFASKSDDKFSAVAWGTAPAGSPVLEDGLLAWVECAVERELAVDGHSIFVGRATAGGRTPYPAAPLIHFDRRYGTWSDR